MSVTEVNDIGANRCHAIRADGALLGLAEAFLIMVYRNAKDGLFLTRCLLYGGAPADFFILHKCAGFSVRFLNLDTYY
jgi:hypothetical protein